MIIIIMITTIITTIVDSIVFHYVRLLGGAAFSCEGASNVSINKKVDVSNNIFHFIACVWIYNREIC